MIDTVNFKVALTFGECNGYMSSQWFVNDVCVATVAPGCKNVEVEFPIKLPCVITVKVSGKNLLTDTIVDSDGRVLKDKFIKIDSMWLAKHPIPEHIYMNLCEVDTGNDKFKTAYFGYPGTILINFNETDAIKWHFKNNHYRIS